MFEIAAAAIRVLAVRVELLEIVAGGERWSVGGEHDDTHGAIMRNRGERIAERFKQCLGQAVARLRPVERQDGDAAVILAQQDRR